MTWIWIWIWIGFCSRNAPVQSFGTVPVSSDWVSSDVIIGASSIDKFSNKRQGMLSGPRPMALFSSSFCSSLSTSLSWMTRRGICDNAGPFIWETNEVSSRVKTDLFIYSSIMAALVLLSVCKTPLRFTGGMTKLSCLWDLTYFQKGRGLFSVNPSAMKLLIKVQRDLLRSLAADLCVCTPASLLGCPTSLLCWRASASVCRSVSAGRSSRKDYVGRKSSWHMRVHDLHYMSTEDLPVLFYRVLNDRWQNGRGNSMASSFIFDQFAREKMWTKRYFFLWYTGLASQSATTAAWSDKPGIT